MNGYIIFVGIIILVIGIYFLSQSEANQDYYDMTLMDEYQLRVGDSCSIGKCIYKINENGSVECNECNVTYYNANSTQDIINAINTTDYYQIKTRYESGWYNTSSLVSLTNPNNNVSSGVMFIDNTHSMVGFGIGEKPTSTFTVYSDATIAFSLMVNSSANVGLISNNATCTGDWSLCGEMNYVNMNKDKLTRTIIAFSHGTSTLSSSQFGVFGVQATETIHTNRTGDFVFMGRFNGTSLTERLRLTGDGKLGLGTSNPVMKMDIVGDLNVTGDINYGGSLISYSPLILDDDICIKDHMTNEWVKCGSYDSVFKCIKDDYCFKKGIVLEDKKKFPGKYIKCITTYTNDEGTTNKMIICNPITIEKSNIDYWYDKVDRT